MLYSCSALEEEEEEEAVKTLSKEGGGLSK
jgi:hypothetical protein